MKKILSALAIVVTAVLLSVSAGAAVLPAPTVKATTISSTRINVSWSKVAGAEKYALYMAERHGNNFTNFGEAFTGFSKEPKGSYGYDNFKLLGKTTALSYTVPKLPIGTMYKFVVVPLDITNGKTTQGRQSVAVLCATGGYNPKARTFHNTNGTTKTEYTYDSKGNILVETGNSDLYGGRPVKTVYTYDSKGNLLTDTFYMNGDIYGKAIYTYDSKGNMLTNTYYGSVSSKDVYTYDSKGNMLTAASTKYYNSIFKSKNVYTYDSKRNMLTDTYYGSDGSVSGKNVYNYDSKGNMITNTYYDSDGSVSSKNVYTYDSNGNLLSADGPPDTDVYNCSYDSKGNILSEYHNGAGRCYIEYTY